MITGIKETCLYVSDLKACKDFYHGILELPVISIVEKRHAFFRVGNSVLLCFIPEVTKEEQNLPAHYAYGPQHIAFSVPNREYAEIKERLSGKGLEITHNQTWSGGRESFYFEDPDGNVLEIVPEDLWDQ